MDMIDRNFHLVDSDALGLSNFPEQSIHALCNRSLQNPLAVFGSPDEMILRIIDGMGGSAEGHTVFYVTGAAARFGFVLSRRKERSFIPRRKQRGILSAVR